MTIHKNEINYVVTIRMIDIIIRITVQIITTRKTERTIDYCIFVSY